MHSVMFLSKSKLEADYGITLIDTDRVCEAMDPHHAHSMPYFAPISSLVLDG